MLSHWCVPKAWKEPRHALDTPICMMNRHHSSPRVGEHEAQTVDSVAAAGARAW